MSAREDTNSDWEALNRRIVRCRRCPRLRDYCRQVAGEKRRAYQDWTYWGKPVPNFGDRRARLLIVGLAPAAHGANRTGRMFTGDRSGEWLYRALHKAGFASQPESTSRDDGLILRDCAITAVCHCAPPANKPALQEIRNCREWLETTVDLLPAKVLLALGQIGWRSVVDLARSRGWSAGRVPRFAHGRVVQLSGPTRRSGPRWLVGSYHPSQQNTFTGKLSEPMFDAVFETVNRLLAE